MFLLLLTEVSESLSGNPRIRHLATRMATLLGTMGEFEPSTEEWLQYKERLEQFFIANSITVNEKKRAVFLSVVGAETFKVLRSLVSPEKPGDKSLADLLQKLEDHFSPKPSEIVERFKFHTSFRKPGESMAAYLARLRALAKYCNFGASLEDMIRDRLVCGINDIAIQKRLLAEPKLTYKKAVEVAHSLERADKNIQLLKQPRRAESMAAADEVHRIPGRRGTQNCYRCGNAGHIAPKCKVSQDIVCNTCGRKGHMKKACRSTGRKVPTTPHKRKADLRNLEEPDAMESDGDSDTLFHVKAKSNLPPLEVVVTIDKKKVKMEVDTGATYSLMSKVTFDRLWPRKSLDKSEVKLCTYSKEPITVMGSCCVNVEYAGQIVQDIPLLVVQGSGPTLFGRSWLKVIRLNWQAIHNVHSTEAWQKVVDKYPQVFEEGLGTLQGYKAKIHVDPNAQPKFCRARSVPYALREKVEKELARLQEEGSIEPVEMAEWAAPIVPVLKADKTKVRICGDFRVTVNPVSKLDSYPIPKVEDLFAVLEKGKAYTKLDLTSAYQQLPLDEDSKNYVVINTQKGLFRYTRLPYGIASAPGIFQRVIDTVLQRIPGVVTYLDDILITGATQAEHLSALEEVLKRLSKAGLRANLKKCAFMKSSVTYLGHVIDEEGLHPMPDKIRAVNQAPTPRSLTELKSYLGLLTYYSKFLPHLASNLRPLYDLLKKGSAWHWGSEQQQAFQKSKEMLTSSKLLTHFDSSLPLVLACDASAYGIGAVLAHRMEDGSEKPLGYVSRTLTKAEKNYSQLEKEGLSCIFGIRRFHSYLFGHRFQLITDHKPLLGLLKEDQATSQHASARIKRWSLFLAAYEYTLTFRNTEAHANADALSRLPLPEEPDPSTTPPEVVLLMEYLDDLPVTANDIRHETRKDPILSKVHQYLRVGWPKERDKELERFSSKRIELSIQDDCILWGSRVVVPQKGQDAIIQELHEGHPGMSKMKALARMYVWWPGIDADIERSVRRCRSCQEVRSSPPLAPLNPWKWPSRPWSRIHLDFAGPFENRMFLVIIDAHSKWIESFPTKNATSTVVIDCLRSLFARFGIPNTVVSDNGTCFVSSEFEAYLKSNGIKHNTSAPYHPASNGLAERAVQIVKRGLKKVTSGDIGARLAKVLFTYRITQQSTTGLTPSELMFGRQLRTRLDLVKPNVEQRVEDRQAKQKEYHDKRARSRTFQVDDKVFVKNALGKPRWIAGTVAAVTGPVSYHVKLNDGRMRRCHQDQLRNRETESESSDTFESEPMDLTIPLPVLEESDEEQPPSSSSTVETRRTYPSRVRAQPDRYEPGH